MVLIHTGEQPALGSDPHSVSLTGIKHRCKPGANSHIFTAIQGLLFILCAQYDMLQ